MVAPSGWFSSVGVTVSVTVVPVNWWSSARLPVPQCDSELKAELRTVVQFVPKWLQLPWARLGCGASVSVRCQCQPEGASLTPSEPPRPPVAEAELGG